LVRSAGPNSFEIGYEALEIRRESTGQAMLVKLVGWLNNGRKKSRKAPDLAGLIGRGMAHWHYATRVEPTWLELNRHDVPIAGLPLPFAGFRVVQLSDFHCGRRVSTAYLAEAVELAQNQMPDLVVLTGDFIHSGFHYVNRVAQVLGRLRAPHGVFAVLGNHDFSVRNALGIRRFPHLHSAVATALAAHGVRVLRNETVRLGTEDKALLLTGVEDLWSRVCDVERAYSGTSEDNPRLVLAHNPITIDHLGGRRCDLMLSGHTHGGQVNLPGLGRVALSRKGKKFPAGMFQVNNRRLYVNKGVGFGFRVRFNVRPEVAVFTLQPE
jgi:predicted MPP superfamily phosphohydrolase